MQRDVVSHPVAMQGYTLHASYYGPRDKTALLLHGGGNTCSADIFPLRVDLPQRGIGTLGLDHRGHGKTGGQLTDSSLAQRVAEARAAIEAVQPQNLLGAVSMSMGGYVAVKLSWAIPLNALIMIAPAKYDARAVAVPFGPAFSTITRHHVSWRNSNAWEILRGFVGQVLIIACEDDRTIPPGVIRCCLDSVPQTNATLISLPGVDHYVMTRLREGDAERRSEVLDSISMTLRGG